MLKHKWDNQHGNTCLNCGVRRQKKSFRLLMAITSQSPYDHYKYFQKYVYTILSENRKKETTLRPDCKPHEDNRAKH